MHTKAQILSFSFSTFNQQQIHPDRSSKRMFILEFRIVIFNSKNFLKFYFRISSHHRKSYYASHQYNGFYWIDFFVCLMNDLASLKQYLCQWNTQLHSKEHRMKEETKREEEEEEINGKFSVKSKVMHVN